MTWHLVLQVKFFAPRAVRAVKKLTFAYFSTVTSQKQFKVVENIIKAVKNSDIYFGQTTQNKSATWHISWVPKFLVIYRDMTWHVSQVPRFLVICRDLSQTNPRQKSSHLSKELSRQRGRGQGALPHVQIRWVFPLEPTLYGWDMATATFNPFAHR